MLGLWSDGGSAGVPTRVVHDLGPHTSVVAKGLRETRDNNGSLPEWPEKFRWTGRREETLTVERTVLGVLYELYQFLTVLNL